MFNKTIIATTLYFMLVLFMTSNSFGQSSQENSATSIYFAQSLFEVETIQEMEELEIHLKSNPSVKQVRTNFQEKRVFVVTNSIDNLTEDEFKSWFGSIALSLKCIQIGKLGVDEVQTFPFSNCEE